MMEKADIERLAEARLSEAVVLLNAGHNSGAYYLAGYAIELALKAVIAKSFKPNSIPEKRFVEKIYTHDLESLISLAELKPDLKAKIDAHAPFAESWEYVAEWSENSRYAFIDVEDDKAEALIEVIRNPDHGVFGWIKTYW